MNSEDIYSNKNIRISFIGDEIIELFEAGNQDRKLRKLLKKYADEHAPEKYQRSFLDVHNNKVLSYLIKGGLYDYFNYYVTLAIHHQSYTQYFNEFISEISLSFMKYVPCVHKFRFNIIRTDDLDKFKILLRFSDVAEENSEYMSNAISGNSLKIAKYILDSYETLFEKVMS